MSVIHPFAPVYDDRSRILILGSFPSVKSREMGFYYGHPRNRFWPLMAELYHEDCPMSIDERRAFLLRNHIALWDVLASCEIDGSSDASIKNEVPCDILTLLASTKIETIFCSGKTAHRLFCKHFPELSAVCLPSTSPANAAMTMEKLREKWKIILTSL
ncbi:MAG: DNA-deoxyinosine glycosylase [Ruminococcaceae bacterium]|nr:DNA-deoxyinosine glycosylase [Oscillospiraceae bacterium]